MSSDEDELVAGRGQRGRGVGGRFRIPRLMDPYSMRLPPTTIDPAPVDPVLLWGHGQHRIDSIWANEVSI
ncbi:unnamed protein product [Linum trigynum]|uniref:Uncharacterized protein n=1 Tax=Linum trigynum TaxID=586398 RepID=A0AAV2DPT7_9ROSI